MEFEPVIGLEVHAQLLTKSKIFCGCSTKFGAPPNTLTCPICLGMPGTLPVLNKKAVEYAIRMGLATNCTIAGTSTFARKNYFYPDLPKGYQISQYDQPLCQNGFIEIELIHDGKPVEGVPPKKIRLLRIHLEEDAGKSIHDPVITGGENTFVDLNRCGVPLIEIVSMPDLDSSAEAYAYLTKLRQIVLYLGINDGNMEEGSLRCDCNVSIRPKGSKELGTRSELKNMNSFRNVERAIEFEIKRQEGILRSGGRVIQETFLWDADQNEARAMRSKEEAHDYRYFPEPDLVPLLVKEEWVEEIRRSLPELPTEKAKRFTEQYKVPKYDSYILTLDKTVADYYEETVKICNDPKLVSNWVMGEVLRILKEANVTIGNFKISSGRLGEMLNLVLNGTINQKIAKTVFEEMMTSLDSPKEIIEKKGLVQVTDITLIEKTVDEVISGNPDQFFAYKSGKDKLIGFFVGEVMKRTQGKANPKIVNEILKKKLGG